jgi:hypothetical protein
VSSSATAREPDTVSNPPRPTLPAGKWIEFQHTSSPMTSPMGTPKAGQRSRRDEARIPLLGAGIGTDDTDESSDPFSPPPTPPLSGDARTQIRLQGVVSASMGLDQAAMSDGMAAKEVVGLQYGEGEGEKKVESQAERDGRAWRDAGESCLEGLHASLDGLHRKACIVIQLCNMALPCGCK